MSKFRTVRMFRALALSIIAAGLAHAGTVDVSALVTPEGPLFQYDYTVTNNDPTVDDLPVLDIAVTPGISITDLTAPSGFETAYDSVLGLVSFLENTQSFGTAPISGFMFDSSVAPAATTFTANLLDLNTFEIVTQSGSTQGPVVPEPSSLAACAVGGLALVFWRRRKQASRAV
jgi:PEP-CTERM motif-containing protein